MRLGWVGFDINGVVFEVCLLFLDERLESPACTAGAADGVTEVSNLVRLELAAETVIVVDEVFAVCCLRLARIRTDEAVDSAANDEVESTVLFLRLARIETEGVVGIA